MPPVPPRSYVYASAKFAKETNLGTNDVLPKPFSLIHCKLQLKDFTTCLEPNLFEILNSQDTSNC